MVKLTEALVLARSRATDVENVRKFNCWGSDLTDIKIIRRMSIVQVLSLSVNKISSLADFAHCKQLEELYIRKNEIADLNEICYLKALPKLRILWLADNPCALEDNYRMTVLKNLPNLQKLDNATVQEDEINAAIEQGHDLIRPLPPCESLDLRPFSIPLTNPTEGAQKRSIVSTSLPAGPLLSKHRELLTESGAGGDVESSDRRPEEQEISTEIGGATSSENKGEVNEDDSPETISWEETNKIRVQLGLKPLPVEKVTRMKPRNSPHSAKSRNANLLQATLHLVKELDTDSLEIVADAVRNRLEDL